MVGFRVSEKHVILEKTMRVFLGAASLLCKRSQKISHPSLGLVLGLRVIRAMVLPPQRGVIYGGLCRGLLRGILGV